jgi:FAD/FMN-containing dehydrogenase
MFDTIRPGDPSYQALRHVYTATGSPAQILRPRSDHDVPAALTHAREHGGPLAIRSGGHGISSRATNDGGVVIDLGLLNRVERLEGRRVRIGAGARWGQVARALRPWSLAISSGDSGDVGVGGLATSGGIGLLGRQFGLTIDHLVAADVVTADGHLRRASLQENPDLFWALRGAGANVGVVTAFEFDAAELDLVGYASLGYAPADLPEFLDAWAALLDRAPREVSAFLYLLGGPQPFAQATVVYAGSDTNAAARAIEPFGTLPGSLGMRAQLTPYASIVPASGAPHAGQQRASTRNGLFGELATPVGQQVTDGLRSGAFGMVQVRSLGGTINDVPSDATAFAHRHQTFQLTAVADAGATALHTAWAPLRDLADGLYLSFQSEHTQGDLMAAFPEPTLSRLRAIKSHWDPDGVFAQNFDVGVPELSSDAGIDVEPGPVRVSGQVS